MFEVAENFVRVAVDRVGGTTKASNLLGVANQTVSTWIRRKRIHNIDYARKLAELAGMELQQLRPTR